MRRYALLLIAAVLLAGPARAQAPRTIEGYTLTPSFHDGFDTLKLDLTGKGQGWVPWFLGFNVRTLKGNQELQLYTDTRNLEALGLPAAFDPLSVRNGVLTIKGERVPQALLPLMPAVKGAPPLKFTSGMISSERSFSQTYGYFEIRAKLPATPGTWPAFWLLSKSGRWPPEIDVFEVIGQEPRRIHQNVIDADKTSNHTWLDIATGVTQWHDYGLLWTADELIWFVDGQETKRARNTINEPMYMIVNLAIGGRWPGTPPPDTPFPALMQIDDVSAYAIDAVPQTMMMKRE